ncbi:MAG: 50S ribosome-binding GTPase [Candidatus Heimdallarchaeota archaeon]|nr:50S ribosome-binding GTPase [Candidatus Heimdallarchaeota archaeon]
MTTHTKLKWYRYNIARRIRNLEGDDLIQELEDIIEDIRNKKLDKIGLFKIQIRELEELIAETKKKPKVKGRTYDPFDIPASGDGRIALFGISNVGKSTLMNAITNTNVKTGAFLHTTREALAGTCEYENVKIQIIDLPGFLDFKEDWNISKQIRRVARTSDAVMMVIDLSMDINRQYDFLIEQLEEAKIIVDGETTYKLGIIATKGDLPDSSEKYQCLQGITSLDVFPTSVKNEESLEKLKESLFKFLDVVRIYTKPPQKKADFEKPFVLPKGFTIKDMLKKIHTSFTERFRYARVWGPSCEIQGQSVGIDYELADSDIVELILHRS